MLAVLAALALGACTPLGVWLYEDPTFELSGVRVTPDSAGLLRLDLAFMACNRNDYDLQASALVTRLMLGGRQVGEGSSAEPILLRMRDSAVVELALHVPAAELAVPADLRERVIPFELAATSTVGTPSGRRPLRFLQRGKARLPRTGSPVWRPEERRACRPGLSVLPPAMGRGRPFPLQPDPMPTPAMPQGDRP